MSLLGSNFLDLPPPHAKLMVPAECAPGRGDRLLGLNAALKIARTDLMYVVNALRLFEDFEWEQMHLTISSKLSGGVMRLQAALDGLVVLEQPWPAGLDGRMTFQTASFRDDNELIAIQERVRSLKSHCGAGNRYADFFSLADFLRIFYPSSSSRIRTL
jgi:hypothetical protein